MRLYAAEYEDVSKTSRTAFVAQLSVREIAEAATRALPYVPVGDSSSTVLFDRARKIVNFRLLDSVEHRRIRLFCASRTSSAAVAIVAIVTGC